MMGQARVKLPERRQVQWRDCALDQLLPSDHRARVVWRFVESLDLSPLYEKIQAVDGSPGRDAVDPRILMSLWMFATIEKISSARQLAKLCDRDIVYQWICGGVGVNYHLLADFRTQHAEILDQVLTDSIAVLMNQGLVTLTTVAQDGMRVKANAGTSSFRRKQTLKDLHKQAAELVKQLREETENEADQDTSNKRHKAAQKRAAEETEARILQALDELEGLEQQKEKNKKGSSKKARCSTTDPESRKMKMGNGAGVAPAFNVQFATDCETRIIIGVDVVNAATDHRQMSPMLDQLQHRYDKLPEQYLVDCGYTNHKEVTNAEQQKVQVHGPIYNAEQMKKRGIDPHARQERDTDESFAFRQRMATDDAKELYKLRASTAEFPNAECRNRGLIQFPVRGLIKAKAIALWHALTFNFMRMLNLEFIS